jgi:hypothetical protein
VGRTQYLRCLGTDRRGQRVLVELRLGRTALRVVEAPRELALSVDRRLQSSRHLFDEPPNGLGIESAPGRREHAASHLGRPEGAIDDVELRVRHGAQA